MAELTTGVSWLAVIVGAVVSFLAGWLWYSPKLFGPKWADGVGVEMGTASEMPVVAMASQAPPDGRASVERLLMSGLSRHAEPYDLYAFRFILSKHG